MILTWIFLTILAAGAAGLLYYSYAIEPHRLEITHHQLGNPASGSHPIRLVQFSDVHISGIKDEQMLKGWIKAINSQHPDLVIFTGDFYDDTRRFHDNRKFASVLKELNCSHRYAVYGNHDLMHGAGRTYKKLMKEAGFTLLSGSSHLITLKKKKIQLSGLADLVHGVPEPVARQEEADCHICLGHEPDNLAQFETDYDLGLSGHSHGGQINLSFLPFYSRLKMPSDHNMSYLAGFYGKIYVNRGLGWTHLPLRFAAVPEISVFDLYLPF